jgi:hypothetical protein
MSVKRDYSTHQATYEAHDETGRLSAWLVYTADPDEPAIWKILLPGPDGTMDLYATEQFVSPDAEQLEAWLTPIVGSERAAELADAVEAEPPPPANWKPRNDAG